MRESTLEKKVTAYAAIKDWQSYKLSGTGDRGKPDRLFMKNGRAVFVEFKRAGRQTTKLQALHLERLTANGFTALVIDDLTQGKALIDAEFIQSKALPNA